MNKTLNEALNDANYSELTSRLFDCLVVPFGGIKNKPYKPKKVYACKESETDYECLEEDIYDSLVGLAKYKISKTLTKKKHILKHDKKSKAQTQKNAKKRVKLINQIHSTSYH